MELTQLRYFQCAAECEHFTKAAEELHITQPTLSKAISSLEKELGVQLFDRDKKGVTLNQYGKELLEFAHNMFGEYNELRKRISSLVDSDAGAISISFSFVDCDPSHFVSCCRQFMQRHPKVSIYKYQQTQSEIIDCIQKKVIDFGFSLYPVDTAGIQWIPLFKDRIGIQVSIDSCYAERESVDMRELEDADFISTNTSPDQTDMLKILGAYAGFQPRTVCNSSNPLFNSELVSKNKGILIMSQSRYDSIMSGKKGPIDSWANLYRFVPLSNDFAVITPGIFFVNGRQLSAIASVFLAFIRGYFSSLPDGASAYPSHEYKNDAIMNP